MGKTYKVAVKRTKNKYDGFSFEPQKKNKIPLIATSNVRLLNGNLQCGIGLETMYNAYWDSIKHDMTSPAIDSVFYLSDRLKGATGLKTLGYLTETGLLYLYDEEEGAFVKTHTFTGKMKMVSAIRRETNDEQYFSMFVGENGLFVHSAAAGIVELSTVKMLAMGCFCGGRAFYALDGHTIVYSAPFKPDDIQSALDGGGRLAIPGEYGILTGMETLFDRVYLFFERGICYVDVQGDDRDMRVRRVAYGGGKICGKTVCNVSVDGKKAFFLADDGIYAMNGEIVWRVAKNLDLKISNTSTCTRAAFDNTYLVTYIATDGNPCAVAVDMESEEGYFSVPFSKLCSIAGEAFCVADGAWHRVKRNGDLPDWTEYAVQSAWTDFNVDGRKTLEKIELFGEGRCKLTLSSDEDEKTAECVFVNGRCTCDFSLRGKEFGLRFVLRKDCKLKGLNVTTQSLQSQLA